MNDIRYGMKRKSIKKLLDQKIESWIETIDNDHVKQLVKRHTIITGGSIASMLLGEKIKDFDVYFRDKETTIAVANYYVQKFNEKNALKAGNATAYQPYVREETIVNCKGVEENRVVIYMQSAGVAAEDQETYEYFEIDPTTQDDFMESLQQYTADEQDDQAPTYRPVFLSQNAVTLSGKMQIVIRFYGEPNEIHDNYDFIHAMNYYDYASGELVLNPEAMEALMSRTLIYKGSLYPICSMFRLRKFIQRGWRVSGGQMLKIAFQISELDLTDRNTLREQLTGVDAAYFHQLLNALQDTDPQKINAAYVAEICDRIFGENM